MISWGVLRGICIVLLFIPIVHVVYLMSRDTLASMDSSPNAWAAEIVAYERLDDASHLPANPIVVVGGRRIKLWTGLDELVTQPILMRGLGQAIVDDIVYHYERLIGFYRPDTLVFMPGNSEFHLRDNKSAEELVEGIKKLVKLDEEHLITRRVYIITPIKTPLFPSDFAKIEQASSQLLAWAQEDPRVVTLDANALLNDTNGKPKPQYFRPDGINLNEHGYLRLSVLLQSAIEADVLMHDPNDA